MNGSATDLLVVGGGMAGLSAGAWAAQHGARVTLVERAGQLGGTAAMAGFIWTAGSYEALREAIPDGDPALARRLVEGIGPAVDWIASLGVTLGPEVSVLRHGRGRQVDMAAYLRTCESIIRRAPAGRVLLGATTERLLTSGEGRVTGAEVSPADGSRERVAADAVLLATGGFQNDPVLTSLLIHPNSHSILRRSNPVSAGGGLRLGLAVGAAFGKDRAGFYGHLVSHPTRAWEPSLFVALTLYHSEHGLLLNRAGRRFIDETLGDHLSAQAVLEQPRGRALLVTDERVRREHILGSYVEGIEPVDKLALVRRYGGRIAVAEDLEELAYLPEEWGYDAQAVLATVHAFNETAASRPAELDPPRAHDSAPLSEPPYYVVETQPAITFTLGGLLIDADARVLDTEGVPIAGLYAAGGDSGGVFAGRGYAGGLALGLVFGLQAARSVVHPSIATG
jgi:succinate dehydrogenase/fumarate reductase flavoprotein subunit